MKGIEKHLKKKEKYIWPATLDSISEELCFFKERGIPYKREEFDVDINDIQFEFGPYYKEGLEKLALERDNLEKIDDRVIGNLEKELNRLNVYVNSSNKGINNFGKAIEASLNKILIESGIQAQVSLPRKNISSYEAAIEILSNEKIVDNIDTIFEKIKKPRKLVEIIERPIMVTKLWKNQRDALDKWLGNGGIGYVNMATATGKTVLGLSTISALYGKLYPDDQDLQQDEHEGDILIVANNRLVLEQWKREFDNHLEIPPEITGLNEEKKKDKIDMDWGSIEFLYYEKLDEIEKNYDLVILDEVHSYPGRVEVFSEEIKDEKIKIIGLSGSIDSSKTDRRKIENRLNRYLKNVKTYTFDQAKKDGIIPDFDWDVIYTGYDTTDDKLKDCTRRCDNLFEKFSDNDHPDIPSFDSFEEARNYSQTEEGIELKEENLEFENFASQLFTRRTTVWNQVPCLDEMEKVLKKHITSQKCLVLVNSNDQVRELEDRLKKASSIENSNIWSVTGEKSPEEQRNLIDEFDQDRDPGVLIGTGNNLGVGVDIQHVEVVINMARGRLVNKSLIQYMGRMLRNPEGKKDPSFFHFVPIPTDEKVRVATEDGKEILEGCSQYLAWGDKINSKPEFSVVPKDEERELRILEENGRSLIEKLIEKNKYSWPMIGINKRDKKDAKTYLKEEILGAEMPKKGSLIIERFGKREDTKIEGVEEVMDEEKSEEQVLQVKDFKTISEDGKEFFEAKVRGPIDWLIKRLESDQESTISEETKKSIEKEEKKEEETEVVELNLSSIKDIDIEIENIYLESAEGETFYPLDKEGEPMSKTKLKETDFSKIENLKMEFRIPESNYELIIVTKFGEKRSEVGKLPR